MSLSPGVEKIWNNRKNSLKQLQDRLSKTPTSRGSSSESDRNKLSSRSGSDLRRGNKLPVPPVSRKAFSKNYKNYDSDDDVSFSSDEIELVISPRKIEKRKKHSHKKRLALTMTPQPPTVFYAPPPVQPMFIAPTMPYNMPFYGVQQQSVMPVVGGREITLPEQKKKKKKSNLKIQSSDQETDSERISTASKKLTKKVRIIEEKDAVDAETSTEGIRVLTPENQSTQVGDKIIPSSATDWDAFFAPRMAPPLLFENTDIPTQELSMLSDVHKTYKPVTPSATEGHFTIDSSYVPIQQVYKHPAHDFGDSSVSGTSPVPREFSKDRTIAWLESENIQERVSQRKLPPIAEEALKSFELLKNEQYGPNNVRSSQLVDGELTSANRRLSRYFNQLRSLDDFILDQEAKLLDRQHVKVEKKVTVQKKPIKTFSLSPRPRRDETPSPVVIPTNPAPVIQEVVVPALPIKTAPVMHEISTSPLPLPKPVVRTFATSTEDHFGEYGAPKVKEEKSADSFFVDMVDSKKKDKTIMEKPKESPKRKKDSIFDRFNKVPKFAASVMQSVSDNILDELVTYEVGRAMQELSIENVSDMIEKQLAEDLEEQRAMTRKLIEKLPPPEEVVGFAVQETEITVQRMIGESGQVSQKAVEDVDKIYRELALPNAAEEVIQDVLNVDLRIMMNELITEESINQVVDDFLINQVVGGEMLKLIGEALAESERRQRRARRREVKDAVEGPVLHSMILDVCLGQVAQQNVILSPQYELDFGVFDLLLQAVLAKMSTTLYHRSLVAECLPVRRYHEKIVNDIAMDAIMNELIKSLDIDMAEVDDFETGRDFSFNNKIPKF